jgi:hypothetical protein
LCRRSTQGRHTPRKAFAGDDKRTCGAFARCQSVRIQFSNRGVICTHSFAISPHVRASFDLLVRPSDIRGRRECRALDAPAALRAKVESTQASHHGHAGSPGIPRAMVLTGSFALSPVTGLCCHRHLADTSAKLDASVGASGPHDFAVRLTRRSLSAPSASIASRPASVTIASRPSVGVQFLENKPKLSRKFKSLIFLVCSSDP